MPEKDRLNVAAEVMHHAAQPYDIDQGGTNTCDPTTVEKRSYALAPAEAARLVADLSLTGKYKATDGTNVALNPTPHGESRNNHPPKDGTRGYSSEIFQVAAVNIELAKINASTNPPGQLRYEQHDPKGKKDTGEVIMDYSKNPPVVATQFPDGRPIKPNSPNVGSKEATEMFSAITGIYDKGMILTTPGGIREGSDERVGAINSEAELQKRLEEAKANGQLPLMLHVFTSNEPFYDEAHMRGSKGDWGSHQVLITDYNPGPPPRATISNNWGRADDHEMNLHDVFRSMNAPPEAAKLLQQEIEADKAAGKHDYHKQMQLLILEKDAGQINDVDYEKQLSSLIDATKKNLDSDPNAKTHREQDANKIADAIAQLPTEAQIRLGAQAHEAGLDDPSLMGNYGFHLAELGYQMEQEDAKLSGISGWWQARQHRQAFEAIVAKLPPDQQKFIHDVMKVWEENGKPD
jgi:hypothetical protein